MGLIDTREAAAERSEAWRSWVLGRVGSANVKVLRMDEAPVVEERHDDVEALLVLAGRLELTVEDVDVSVGSGEVYLVPAGARHSVRPGSHGVLVIVEAASDRYS